MPRDVPGARCAARAACAATPRVPHAWPPWVARAGAWRAGALRKGILRIPLRCGTTPSASAPAAASMCGAARVGPGIRGPNIRPTAGRGAQGRARAVLRAAVAGARGGARLPRSRCAAAASRRSPGPSCRTPWCRSTTG
eukprot:150822-Prymnesium_polylepis.1